MISIDSLTNAVPGLGGTQGGGKNELHRNGWLLELERAWLAFGNGKKGEARAGADPKAPSAHRGEPSMGADAGEAPWAALKTDASPIAFHPQATQDGQPSEPTSGPSMERGNAASAVNASGPSSRTVENLPRQPQEHGSSGSGSVGAGPQTGNAQLAAKPGTEKAMLLSPAALMGMPVSSSAFNEAGSVFNAAGSLPGAAVQINHAAAVVESGIVAASIPSAESAQSTASTFASQSSFLSESPEDIMPLEESALPDTAAPASTESTEDDAYPQRRLHVFEDDQGIRVWIRDAALSEERGHAIAEALRGEFGAQGMRLVAVALNGRKIAGQEGGSQGPAEASSEEDAAYARSMIKGSNLFIEKLPQRENS